MLFWHEGFPTREPHVSMWNLQEKAESVLGKKTKQKNTFQQNLLNIYTTASFTLKLSSTQLIEWVVKKLHKIALRKIIGLLFLAVW